ncbi:MAG: 5'-3' exoribonuclease [Chlamydiia bacterium]|nr:5'-3' exoribonuclease [Chlamydiia bacterium]MCH9618099.1 5'-3' exoribonuclease [Chlamydiia bacterium]MCH9623979.1 5'-3' exoribonuclease [Chlamydiia bacterium]
MHCHSTCSDGSLSPIELLNLAKESGLHGISITDHDTVAAYTQKTFDHAKKIGVDLIPGVEFSTVYNKREGSESVHILGYGIDIHHEKIKHLQKLHEQRRKERFEQILSKLKAGGFDLTDGNFDKEKRGSVGRPHIALALIEKGYAADMKMAFRKFLGDRAPYFVPSNMPSIEETIATIKIAGGKAILAHPILIKGRKILRKIMSSYQFDGMECYYGNFPRDRIEFLLKMCEHKNLLITGGSDFHGEHRTFVTLGSSFMTKQALGSLLSRC